jgi:hypothetical protein
MRPRMADWNSRRWRAVIGLRRDPERNKIDLGQFCLPFWVEDRLTALSATPV